MKAPAPWIQRLLGWLRRLLGQPRPSIKILEQYHNGGSASVLRLQDPSVPGSVDLWRIDKHYERHKFFVCIIEISQFREDLATARRGSTRGDDRRGLADSLWEQIGEQREIVATHFWITGWQKEYSGIDKAGRHYRSQRLADLRLHAVDLQGVAGPFSSNRYAKAFARKAIVRLAANEFRELRHARTWEDAVKVIDWPAWLEGMARASDGISPDHVLQPKRSRRGRLSQDDSGQ